MRRYAVVGAPVRHSLSPWIHAHFARTTQRPIVYAAHVPAAGFDELAKDFFTAGSGLNITAPFKRDALNFAGCASAFARRAGAANVLLRDRQSAVIAAYNTDGAGLIKDLKQHCGVLITGRQVLIAGAGGAARASAMALADAGARLTIAARKPAAAAELAAAVGGRPAALDACGGGFDIVINAISGGAAAESPLPAVVFKGALLAYDLNYGQSAAAFLSTAAAARQRADGSGMLVEQAALSFALWEGVLPATAALIHYLRAHHRRLWAAS